MSKNTDIARKCGMNAILGGGWWFETDAQLDAFAERVLAEQKTLYALLLARVREQDVRIAQMKASTPEGSAR